MLKYICDNCKKELDKTEQFSYIVIFNIRDDKPVVEIRKEICQKCKAKIIKIIEDEFNDKGST